MEEYTSLLNELNNALAEYCNSNGQEYSYNCLFVPVQKTSNFLISKGIFIFPKTKKERSIPENENPIDSLKYLKLVAERARNRIWEDNLGLVGEVTKKCLEFSPKLEYGDVNAEGIFGLLGAIRNYNTSLGVRFPYYATATIIRYIMKNLYKYLRTIKLPIDFPCDYKRFEYFREKFKEKFKHLPSDEELARFMGKTTEYVRNIRERKENLYNVFSLNYPAFAGDEEELSDSVIDSYSSTLEERVLKRVFLSESFMPVLSPVEKKVILSRLKGKEFKEIGRENNFSKARAHEAKKKALKKRELIA